MMTSRRDRRSGSKAVRYGRNNTLLRYMLWSIWNYRYYWCSKPKDFTDTQIDHIIPQSVSPSKRTELFKAFVLPDDYDLDDPRNLAPICADCNGPNGKGGNVLAPTPALGGKLEKAKRMRSDVIKRVNAFNRNSNLGKALLRVSESDLNNDESRRLFEELAPGVVQKLALINKDKADFQTWRTENVEVERQPPLEIVVSVNSRGRTALTILEEVWDCNFSEIFADPVDSLRRQIMDRTQVEFESIEPLSTGVTNAGPPSEHYIDITISPIDFSRVGSTVEFTFTGHFDTVLSASLVQGGPDGDGLDELQGEAVATGSFSFDIQCDSSMDAENLDIGEPSITSWQAIVDLSYS
ncbi:hypothetical protein LWF01_17540 [Saxibacter everestensis]|uniref:HNH endonuclease n=1 Tax=Saxibacter everestensis TaxID=2909229 RepID=A0ABY8QSG9_9MICO|nr:hypothetical protein LWF01_17540 [Brevibacteriaceae bacterium ZFBP1038]